MTKQHFYKQHTAPLVLPQVLNQLNIMKFHLGFMQLTFTQVANLPSLYKYRSMKRFFYLFIQFTWGLGQSIIGFSFFLRHFRYPHRMYRGAIETQWNSKYSGLSLGPFIFTPTNPDENYCTGVRTHEYGHTIQSLILGPLYAIVGIISVVWGSLIHPMLRKKTKKEPKYTACFVEYNASWLGEKVTGEKAAW